MSNENLNEENVLPKDLKTKYDHVFNKAVFVNGKKLGGVRAVDTQWDIDSPLTTVILRLHILKDSLKMDSTSIHFDVDLV